MHGLSEVLHDSIIAGLCVQDEIKIITKQRKEAVFFIVEKCYSVRKIEVLLQFYSF